MSGYRHGLRVRLYSIDGPIGVLLRCERRTGAGYYWKIRLRSGSWVFPPREAGAVIVDGPGTVLADSTCLSCHLPFMAETVDASVCDRCMAESTGAATRHDDDPPRRQYGVRRRSHS